MDDFFIKEKEAINYTNILGVLLSKTCRNANSNANKILASKKISFLEWIILNEISKNNDFGTILDLLQFDQGMFSRYIKKLENLGLIKSEMVFDDGKGKVVLLTKLGKLIHNEVLAELNLEFGKIICDIAYKDFVAFCRVLHTISRNLIA